MTNLFCTRLVLPQNDAVDENGRSVIVNHESDEKC